jgi:polyketide cyclase/dehydrase/lipid transport protein
MGVDITARVHIERDPPAVAAFMTDPANDPRWIGGLREAELLGEGPVSVGSRVRRVAYFLGRRVEYVNEVLALDATRLDMRSVKAPFPMHITYRFEPAPNGGTAVSNHVRGGGLRLFAPLVRRNVQRDLNRLRHLLES